jgi:hypothetical protein
VRSAFEIPRPTLISKPGETIHDESDSSSFSFRKRLEDQRRLDEPLKKMSVLSPIETSGAATTLEEQIQNNRLAAKQCKRRRRGFFINQNGVYGINQ